MLVKFGFVHAGGEAKAPPKIITPVDHANGGTKYGLAALEGILTQMRAASQGNRNDTLNKVAFRAGQLSASGDLVDRPGTWNLIKEAACGRGLADHEVEKTFSSGFEKGLGHPAQHTERPEHLKTPAKALPREVAAAKAEAKTATVYCTAGKRAEATRQAMRIYLRAAAEGGAPMLFDRGGAMVRLVSASEIKPAEGAHLSPQAPAITPLTAPALGYFLGDIVSFKRFDERREDWKDINPPKDLITEILAVTDKLGLPILRQILTAPTIGENGKVIDQPGYDPDNGLFLVLGDLQFPAAPERPNMDNAKAALEQFYIPLIDFPFITQNDKAVWLAGLMTALVRHLFDQAPLFAFTSPVRGSGKSTLARLIAIITQGFEPALLSWPRSEDEARKTILTMLIAGTPIVLVDNVVGAFGSNTLNIVLTTPRYRGRILGESREVSLPTCVTWLVTGNNFQALGDTASRVALCRLDPRLEKPEDREFSLDPILYALKHRAELAVAALTVLRAFILSPDSQKPQPPGCRFGAWAGLIRSALIWAEAGDPWANADQLEAQDPEREELAEILGIWQTEFGEESRTAAKALKDSAALTEAFKALYGTKEVSTKRVGRWLTTHEGRVVNDRKLKALATTSEGGKIYRIVPAAEV